MSIATATIKGGFWEVNNVGTLVSVSGEGGVRGDIPKLFNTKGLLALREIAFTLVGAAAGGTATKNYGRVVAAEELGGLRPTENQVLVNRVTTAADVAEIKNDILRLTTRTSFGGTPPANLDRNPLGTR